MMTQSSFIQIPLELINYVRTANLPGTQYNLWLYLFSRDPYQDSTSPIQIATELGLSSRTIQRGLVKLQELNLLPCYSAYYPDHRKRIHLFGENLDKLPDIESACLLCGVIVTGEEVKNG